MRRTKHKVWTEDDARMAIDEVRRGVSIRKAAKNHGVSEAIFRYRLSRVKQGLGLPGSGRNMVLNKSQEGRLCRCINALCSQGFSPSMTAILDLVGDFVKINNIKTPFSNDRPGSKWMHSFMHRNNLSLKKADMINVARKSVTSNPFVIYDFYEVVDDLINKKNLGPTQVWICNETSLSSDPASLKAVCTLEKKAYSVTGGEDKDNTSILASCNAAGKPLDPLVIFKGKKLQSTWRGDGALPELLYTVTESGWMTTEVFASWFKAFAGSVKERPLLMIFDGHLTHVSLSVIEFAIAENITILKLPPNMTDLLQPLHLTCFSPLKGSWAAMLNSWNDIWGTRVPIRKSILVNELWRIWHDWLTDHDIQSVFASSGIYPVDRTKFPVDRFDCTLLRRYEAWISIGRPDGMLEDLAFAPWTAKKTEEVEPKISSDLPCTSSMSQPRVSMPLSDNALPTTRPDDMLEDLAFTPCTSCSTVPYCLYCTNEVEPKSSSDLPCTSSTGQPHVSIPLSDIALPTTHFIPARECPIEGCVCVAPPDPIPGKRWELLWDLEDETLAKRSCEKLLRNKIKGRKVNMKARVVTDPEFVEPIREVQEKQDGKARSVVVQEVLPLQLMNAAKQNRTRLTACQLPTIASLCKVVSRARGRVRAAPAAPARLADPVIPENCRISEVQPSEAEFKTKPIRSSIGKLYTSKHDSDVKDEILFRPRKRVAVIDDSDSAEGSNSAEWASDSDYLESISYSDLYEVDSSEDSNPSERIIGDLENLSDADSSKGNHASERAIGDLENVSEADSSKGSGDSSERASDDLEKISKAKKRRKINGNVENDAKNGDRMDRISDGKVKKYVKQEKFPSDMSELEKICLVCGTGDKIATKHPLFIGGLCKEHMLLCHEKFFEYDSDGYNSTCCICSMGTSLVICDKLDCGKCYCRDCLTRFIDSGVYNDAAKSNNWMCNFCKNSKEGLLRKRAEWQEEIQRLYKNTDPQFPPFPVLPTVPQHERKPIRVLSLFDGISAGAVALKQLGIEIERFVASEIHEDAIRLVKNKHPEIIHVGDITKLSDKEIYDLGPFDLVLGGSPCNDLSSVNPKRKGLIDADGTGCLFFDYYRILRNVEPPSTNDLRYKRPFFWLFENVTSMKEIEKQRISRFLQCEPRMADARYVSAACRSRLFWGNLPGLMDRELTPGVNDCLTVQECLESGRKARVEKLNTITAKYSSLYQGMQNRAPVVHGGEEDVLWTTEVERVFGVPEHYTDVNNLGPRERVALLGRSWSVPVVRQLLSPLKDYFKCNLN